jgi:predicted GH43/DUF377 family glycosyl hydrolase
MYWGEGVVYAATSDDLVRWTPVESELAPDRYLNFRPATATRGVGWKVERVPGPSGLLPVASPRRRRFDSLLAEPGPPAVLTADGIVLIYNGANHPQDGEPGTASYAYQPGQLLLDPEAPAAVVGRAAAPFLRIDPAEAAGQVGNVCFAQGLVAHRGEWLLYLGLADSRLGVATAPIR